MRPNDLALPAQRSGRQHLRRAPRRWPSAPTWQVVQLGLGQRAGQQRGPSPAWVPGRPCLRDSSRPAREPRQCGSPPYEADGAPSSAPWRARSRARPCPSLLLRTGAAAAAGIVRPASTAAHAGREVVAWTAWPLAASPTHLGIADSSLTTTGGPAAIRLPVRAAAKVSGSRARCPRSGWPAPPESDPGRTGSRRR